MSWLKQTNRPLFEDLIWSKPENKQYAGKLLIIGGNLYSFNAPSEAYQTAQKEGAGTIRLVLPEPLKKTLQKMLPESEFAPTNPSGGFSKMSLLTIIENGLWADTVLIAGDTGRNSETAILFESFLRKYQGNVVLSKDAVDLIVNAPDSYSKRNNTTLVISLSQLQKITKALRSELFFKYSFSNNEVADNLAEITRQHSFCIVTFHNDKLWCALNGRVSSTDRIANDGIWITKTAAKVAVWQMQNLDKIFESTTTALLEET
jgi:hypothetical protein